MEEMNYLKSKVENFDQNAVEKYRSLKFEADPSKKQLSVQSADQLVIQSMISKLTIINNVMKN